MIVSFIRFQEGYDHFRVIIHCEGHCVLQEDFHTFPSASFESSAYPIASTTIPKNIGMFSIFDELKVQLINLSEEDGLIEQVSIPVICIDRKEASTLKLTDLGVELIVTFNIISLAPSPEKIDHLLKTNVETKVVPASRIVPDYKYDAQKVIAPKSMEKTMWKLQVGDLYRLFQALYMSLLLGGHTFKHMLTLCWRIIRLLDNSSQHLMLSLVGFNLELMHGIKNLLILFAHRISDVPYEMQLCVLELLDSANMLVFQQYEVQLKPKLKATLSSVSPVICPIMKILQPVSNFTFGQQLIPKVMQSPSQMSFFGHVLQSSSTVLAEVKDLCTDCLEEWESKKVSK